MAQSTPQSTTSSVARQRPKAAWRTVAIASGVVLLVGGIAIGLFFWLRARRKAAVLDAGHATGNAAVKASPKPKPQPKPLQQQQPQPQPHHQPHPPPPQPQPHHKPEPHAHDDVAGLGSEAPRPSAVPTAGTALERGALVDGPIDAGALFGNPTTGGASSERRRRQQQASGGGGGGGGGGGVSSPQRKHDMSPRPRGLEVIDDSVLSTLEDLAARCEATGLMGLGGHPGGV